MNFAFTKIIKAGERQREFNFRQMPGSDTAYHVDVSDDRGNRLIFKLTKEENGQMVIRGTEGGDLPKWIWDSTPKLQDAINEKLQS